MVFSHSGLGAQWDEIVLNQYFYFTCPSFSRYIFEELMTITTSLSSHYLVKSLNIENDVIFVAICLVKTKKKNLIGQRIFFCTN